MIKSNLAVVGILIILVISCQRNPYQQGQVVYETFCLNCHMEDGKGLGAIYPNLQNSEYLSSKGELLPCLIRTGIQSSELNTVAMPAHKEMTEATMTNLINYMNYRWGNQEVITLEAVMSHLENCSTE